MTVFIFFTIIGLFVLFTIGCFIFGHKRQTNYQLRLDAFKKQLDEIGIKINHSYKLVNKNNPNKISYIRIYDLYISYNNDKNIYANAYLCNAGGHIGEWLDNAEYLLSIPNTHIIEDMGEWDPNEN